MKVQRADSPEFLVLFLLRVTVFKLFFRRITNQYPCNGCKNQQYKTDKKVVCQKHFQFFLIAGLGIAKALCESSSVSRPRNTNELYKKAVRG